VVIFDLLAAETDPALRDGISLVIGDIFSDPSCIKAGFAVNEDIILLQKSFPNIGGFAVVEKVVDIGKLSGSVKRPAGGKLSDLAEMWLGKPLDKTEQTSDWNERPLDGEQVSSFALKASCRFTNSSEVLRIFDDGR